MLLHKYNLMKHPYMTQIYEVRSKWAKPNFMAFFLRQDTIVFKAVKRHKAEEGRSDA